MELAEYLSLSPEQIPYWLANFNENSVFDREHFFGSRVVYYPGSGFDGHPVQVFGSADWAHCFVYVDSHVELSELHRELASPTYGFAGYSSLRRIPLTWADLVPRGRNPHDLPRLVDGSSDGSPGFLEVLARHVEKDAQHGPSRLAVLFLHADAFAAYQALFDRRFTSAPPHVVVVQDHGFGRNLSKFGRDGELSRIAGHQRMLPDWLFVAEYSDAWEGYQLVDNVEGSRGGRHSDLRHLYRRIDAQQRPSELRGNFVWQQIFDDTTPLPNRRFRTVHRPVDASQCLRESRLFDAYVFVDWSASQRPRQGADSIWIGAAEFLNNGDFVIAEPINPETRMAAEATVAELLLSHVQAKHRVLVGFDFPYGYPNGWHHALGVNEGNWTALWDLLTQHIADNAHNTNNRFVVANHLNAAAGPAAGPFWGRPQGQQNLYEHLPATRPNVYNDNLAEFRQIEVTLQQQGRWPKSVWQLFYNGSVGSQTLMGIPVLNRLRFHDQLRDCSVVWPFEAGWHCPATEGPLVVHAEIWPGAIPVNEHLHDIKDAAQVLSYVEWAARHDLNGTLAARFNPHAQVPNQSVQTCEGWILGD